MMNVTYTAAFLFWRDQVLLVQKNRPEWQAGLWNAIGGKVEDGETLEQANVREFGEETGLLLPGVEWRRFCAERGPLSPPGTSGIQSASSRTPVGRR